MPTQTSPFIVEAYQLSLTSGPLLATAASLDAAMQHGESLPQVPERMEVQLWTEACWRNCMLVFSAGQECGRGTNISASLEAASEINADHARLAIQHAVRLTLNIAKAKPVAVETTAKVERFLLQCGELINTLFAAGRIDGQQVRDGIAVALPKPDQDKTC